MDRIVRDYPYWMHSLVAWQDGWGLVKVAAVFFGAISGYVLDGPGTADAALGAAILILLDTVTGYLAAVVKKRPRTSVVLGRVLTKTFGYMSVVVVAAVLEQVFPGSGAFTVTVGENAIPLSLVGGVLWLIIAVEGYSILENVEEMGLGRFRFLRRILGKALETVEEEEPGDRPNRRPDKEQ